MDYESCHRALYCVDILEAVLGTLDLHDRTSRATCAHAALVCRSFCKTALPLTWRVLPTFDPLWNLFLPLNVSPENYHQDGGPVNSSTQTHRGYKKWRMNQYKTASICRSHECMARVTDHACCTPRSSRRDSTMIRSYGQHSSHKHDTFARL